ncbi:MAG TPA: AAA family ATPase [Polyangiaceae bacterium]|nr:AAA family ATPase [Polyangiaceae bacterium]
MIDLSAYSFQKLRTDGEIVLSRAKRPDDSVSVLLMSAASEHPSPSSVDRIKHTYSLRDELDSSWAIRPLELLDPHGIPSLLLDDPGGLFLDDILQRSSSVEELLRLAIAITSALGGLHARKLIHRDIKPANLVANAAMDNVWLTGLGLTSRLPRYRQLPDPPDVIAGTLAYMAPEQTGRMNRSIDSRSDLYSLGVTLYEMFVGALPFEASDAMGWVHCHIARVPAAPIVRRSGIPEPLSAIILKLLAKTPEERYQTARGVENDLRRVLAAAEAGNTIESFRLCLRDVPDRLLIPEKLYGREREVDVLLAAFDRVVTQGGAELVLVSGYSGVGKSSLVNELHKVLVPPRGLFASGKFDQYKRDIPYSTLVQAFQSLVRPLLGKSDAELSVWRGAILEALEPNARLMTDLIPELKLIIGEQPPVMELEPQQAQGRFQLVFRRFLGVFARAEHPLALFLDDLQWLDAATLDLLEDLLTRSELQHLMLIGAYRNNEVDAGHPLMRRLQTVRKSGAKVDEVTLGPLASEHVKQLIAEALCCEPERAAPLAALVHGKTAGNPFFVIQFLHALYDEGLLHFEHALACWSWDLDRIHDQGYTDNVVDLMVGKLSRLPAETQRALQQLACLGNVTGITTLSTVLGVPENQVHAALWEAVRQELVERLEDSCRFGHDRIHEAAYSLIPPASRSEAHLRIGRLLAAQTPPEKLEEAIFEIVGQLNRGAPLITSRDEREYLAGLNLLAGQRAKASTAYASALMYLVTGTELLNDDCWERRHELMFALELDRAACEFLTGQVQVADERLKSLSNRATTTIEQASVACLHTDVCTTLDQSDRAVAVCLDYLRQVGIEWSPHPNEEEVRREYESIGSRLAGRTIEELIDLPPMEDVASLATAEVLTKLFAPALQTDGNLVSLMSCKAVTLSLERGNCDASCFAYVLISRVAGPRFGDYQFGFRFGQLGYDLVERRGLKRFEAKTYVCFSIFNVRWMKPVRACRDLLDRAFAAAILTGDVPYGGYARNSLNSDLLFSGEALSETQVEAERGLAYAEKVRFGLVIDFIATQLALIRMLRGLTSTFGCFDDGQFDELRIEDHLSSNPALAVPACCYWIRKLQARYLADDYAAAMDAAAKAQPLLWTSSSFYEEAEYHFYAALTQAAWCDSPLVPMVAHHRQLQIWAENCPENFADRAALVGAEIARLEGRVADAELLYERAIRSAQESGFVHNEAIVYEVAARFYAARGLKTITLAYLRNARACYLRWGADGKVRQLELLHPHLAAPEGQGRGSSNATIGTSVGQLDAETVARASQALSSEIVLPKLIDTLMRLAIEHAGAQRGLLMLPHGDQMRIQAEATTSGATFTVRQGETEVIAAAYPELVVQFVARTHENVILADAAAGNAFSLDSYLLQSRARSILCVPLLKQAKLIGILYLENNLASHVFTPARVAVLGMVASAAAISLENTRLYGELAERETKIRRLVESNILGITIWNTDGQLVEANDAFLLLAGYSREDFVSSRVRWTDLTPAEWRDRDTRALAEIKATGKFVPFEKEYFRRDGSRVSVLVGGAIFEENGSDGVAFVLDLTERKRAEEALHRAQTELAQVTRATTMGVLAASIAHEVNQPLSGIITNAGTCLRMLQSDPPDVEGAKETARRTLRDGKRASDVITRLRALFSSKEFAPEPMDLHEAVREVIALTLSDLQRSGVVLKCEFAEELELVNGDRVQLQQVILNLIHNASEAMDTVHDRPRDILIRTGREGNGYVCLSVRDAGTGFKEPNMSEIFEPFYTTKNGGMGIGLAVSRSIIERHQGRLWAESNDAAGATFAFSIPPGAGVA